MIRPRCDLGMHSICCDNIAAPISLHHCSSDTLSVGVSMNAAWSTANHVECSDERPCCVNPSLPSHPWYISRAKSCRNLGVIVDRPVVTPSGAVSRQIASKLLYENGCSNFFQVSLAVGPDG